MSPQELLNANRIGLESYKAGRYYVPCPQCSHMRSRAHQESKCLGVTIEANKVYWGCNHCGWSGPESNGKSNGHTPSKYVATFDYVDECGVLLFQVCRTTDKQFPQRRPDGNGGYVWGTKGVRKVPYRLPELIEAVASEHPIFIPEGEKDVESLRKLGLAATCNPGGASKPGQRAKWLPEYSEFLRGADVVVLPDNDEPGRAHAQAIVTALDGVAKCVRVLDIAKYWPQCPEAGGDISDWLAAGHTREELDTLIATAPDYVPGISERADDAPPTKIYWHGDVDPLESRPQLINKVLPETGTGLASGQWGTYKTFVVIDIATSVMSGIKFIDFPVARRGGVLFIAPEGASEIPARIEGAIKAKCPEIGRAPFAWIETCPALIDPKASTTLATIAQQVAADLKAKWNLPLALIVIDTVVVSAGYTKDGQDNDAAIGQRIMSTLATLSKATGTFVLGVDHFGKSVETGTRGTSAKEGAADVVLALLGERTVAGKVTDSRLALRKRRGGVNGEEFPFTTRVVDLGLNRFGEPETTLTIEWAGQDARNAPTKDNKTWSKSLRLLQRSFMAVLADQGTDQQPFANGPVVRAVDLEAVRAEFYKSHPADGTEKQKQAARRQAFNRATKDAQANSLIGIRNTGNTTLAWLVAPDNLGKAGP